MTTNRSATIPWQPFSAKHKAYIKAAKGARMMCAEGAIRSGKTIDNCIIAAAHLELCGDRIHLASGPTLGNAKLNIGDCNGFGLEHLFRGRCRWGKYKDNDALIIRTQTGEKIVIFAGGGKADSYKRILGNSYGLWIATEINEHYDCEDSRSSFIKVAFGRQAAAEQPLTLWDLNPCSPGHPIYADYIDGYKDKMPGYVYEHFTMRDNLAIPPERLEEIAGRYDPNTIWYRRDILGERCMAAGLCYPLFADTPDRYIIDTAPTDIIRVIIGVDFGGTGSGHAFTATGITSGYRSVVTLDEYYHNNKRDGRLSPAQLEAAFVAFVQRVQTKYRAYECFADSAEQTLIEGLQVAALSARLGLRVGNALKLPINERIRFYNSLMAQDRYKILRSCPITIGALTDARYDPKKTDEDVRLDDGTTNIDSLDSLEYTTERLQKDIISLGRMTNERDHQEVPYRSRLDPAER